MGVHDCPPKHRFADRHALPNNYLTRIDERISAFYDPSHRRRRHRPASTDRHQEKGVFKFFNSLFGRVVIALVVGIVLGALFPQFAQALRPLGDGFLKLIKMIIGPIVFCVVVGGMARAGDLKKVGRVGLKAVAYFEVMTTIALVIGAVLAYVTKPGVGMNIDLHTLDAASLDTYTGQVKNLKDTSG